MKDNGIIILRHVRNHEQDRLWKECMRCIRAHDKNITVMIIDDDSDLSMITMDEDTKELVQNTIMIRSEFPRCGEMLGYYYMHKLRIFRKAIVMHDSVFLMRIKEEWWSETEACKFLWYFSDHCWDDIKRETELIQMLDSHEDMLNMFYPKKHLWMGCFGAQAIVSLEFVDRLQEKYKLFRLLSVIKTRIDRIHMERILGCIFTYEEPRLFFDTAVNGTIHKYFKWGYKMDEYLVDNKMEIGANRDMIKVWSGR